MHNDVSLYHFCSVAVKVWITLILEAFFISNLMWQFNINFSDLFADCQNCCHVFGYTWALFVTIVCYVTPLFKDLYDCDCVCVCVILHLCLIYFIWHLCLGWFCRFDLSINFHVNRFWNVYLLMTKFGHPELTLHGWQDVKIQKLLNWCVLEHGFLLFSTHRLFLSEIPWQLLLAVYYSGLSFSIYRYGALYRINSLRPLWDEMKQKSACFFLHIILWTVFPF